ncbi:hypothetical protein [Streptomyces sp. 3N207]|uniref:hypothetical protein n=1 Tax=Streptomyces sp. 3N207 TaxID=3457417 RepID=UPI003FCFCE78
MPPRLKETLAEIGTSPSRSAFEEAVHLLGDDLARVPEIQQNAEVSADASHFLAEDLQSWLLAQNVDIDAEVLGVWLSDGLAARASYGKFVEVIDDLWYPSSDDVAIIALNPNGMDVIIIDHEEKISLTRMKAPGHS